MCSDAHSITLRNLDTIVTRVETKNCVSNHKRTPRFHTIKLISSVISLEIVWTRIILLHAHFVYYNCVKFHQYGFIQ